MTERDGLGSHDTQTFLGKERQIFSFAQRLTDRGQHGLFCEDGFRIDPDDDRSYAVFLPTTTGTITLSIAENAKGTGLVASVGIPIVENGQRQGIEVYILHFNDQGLMGEEKS